MQRGIDPIIIALRGVSVSLSMSCLEGGPSMAGLHMPMVANLANAASKVACNSRVITPRSADMPLAS